MESRMVRCADVLDIRDGTHDSPKYVLEGYPLITSKNIKDGNIEFDNINYITKDDFNKINIRSKVDNGDILMPMIGTIGNPVIVNTERSFAIKNVALFKFQDCEDFYNKYVYYALKSPMIVNQLNRNKRGGTQSFVSLGDIRDLKIPNIDIESQQKIATILDKAQSLIDKRKEQIEACDELVKSLFYEMFGDPATNPLKWEIGTIRDLASEVKYGTSKKAYEGKGAYPILRMNNITYQGNWDLNELKYIDLEVDELDKYLVYKGDMLFNRTNSKELVGKTAVYNQDEPMAYAGYLVRLRTNERANSKYISVFLNSPYGKLTLQGMCKSIVGMANINAQELQDIKIPIPPLPLQNKFAAQVEKIEHQKQLLEQSLKELENNFNSLMQRAFKGELF